jgi:parvulin-like peptidyl-prolyl isomerase
MTYAANQQDFRKNSKSVQKQIQELEKQADVRYYLDRTILDSIVSEEKMLEAYNQMNKEVNASHILIQYRDVNPKIERTQTEAIALAENIAKKAKEGENFAKLAEKYSEDTGTAKDGNLGYFGWGRMVDPFQKKAFSMEIGEISEPVETRFGYHIIKVNNIRKTDILSFEEEKNKIQNALIKRNKNKLQDAYRQRVEDLKTQYGYKINEPVVDSIIAKVELTRKASGPVSKSEIEILKSLEIEKPIATFNGKDVPLENLIEKLEDYTLRLPPTYVNQKYFKIVMDNFYVTELFLLDYKNRNIPMDEQYKKSVKNQIDQIVLREFKKENFYKDYEISDEEIETYYNKNKEEKYMTAGRSEVREIFMLDKEKAEEILQNVLENPEKFDDYSAKLTERFEDKEQPGLLGNITENQYGEIGRIANTMNANTIHSELIKAGKGWSIIKVNKKIEPVARDLKDIEATIRRILLTEKREQDRKNIMEDLKKKYNYKIYWDCVNIEK